MGKDNLEVVEALKKNNFLSEEIKNLHSESIDRSRKIRSCIKDIIELSNIVLKNLSTDKKEVCTINCVWDDTSYYSSDNEYFQKLFLNRDGFSLSTEFNKKWLNQPTEDSRSSYIQNVSITRYLKIIKKILEHKQEALDKASKNKKEVLEKYFKAIEDSGFNNVFSYEDFCFISYYFKEDRELLKFVGNNSGIANKISKDKISGLVYREDNSVYYLKDRKKIIHSSYYETIQFTEIERISQIYDELVEMFGKYKEKQDTQFECLSKLKSELKDNFERELVANSL